MMFDELCHMCNGSGEGNHDGSICQACGGSGYEFDEEITEEDKAMDYYPEN